MATSPVARLVLLDVNVDVDSVSGGTSTATDNDMLAVPLQPDFDDEDIDEEAQFIALLKKKDEDTKLKAKPKKQVITAPSDTADKEHLVLLMLLLKLIHQSILQNWQVRQGKWSLQLRTQTLIWKSI